MRVPNLILQNFSISGGINANSLGNVFTSSRKFKIKGLKQIKWMCKRYSYNLYSDNWPKLLPQQISYNFKTIFNKVVYSKSHLFPLWELSNLLISSKSPNCVFFYFLMKSISSFLLTVPCFWMTHFLTWFCIIHFSLVRWQYMDVIIHVEHTHQLCHFLWVLIILASFIESIYTCPSPSSVHFIPSTVSMSFMGLSVL